MENDNLITLNKIAQAIYDKKGFNILALDVRGLSSITDFIVIAEGNVDRHVIAIARSVVDELQTIGEIPYCVEGEADGDWVVVDYSSIMVHLFQPGMREKYQLESLWKEAKIVDLEINVANEKIES